MIRKLEPIYWRCEFNTEMIMSLVADDNYLKCYGNFRSRNDFGSLIWYTEDNWSHPSQKLDLVQDFSGFIWECDYEFTGHINDMDEIFGPSLTIEYTTGEILYVRLWNYVIDRPQQDWELGGGVVFPSGRTFGTATGNSGHLVIDFDNLYAGWSAYVWDGAIWAVEPNWQKVDQTKIKSMKWSFTPSEYDMGERVPLDDSYEWSCLLTNWSVSGNTDLMEEPAAWDEHDYRLALGYDDEYMVSSKLFIKHFYNLGFREKFNLYIGASHYYDKFGTLDEEPRGHVPYRYETKGPSGCMNIACEEWFNDFCYWANEYGFNEVIASFSQEMVDSPADWVQLNPDGVKASTGWEPTPWVNATFTNTDCQDFYKALVKKMADIQNDNGLSVIIQVGESWYWTENDKPCFYDEATKAAFREDYIYNPYEFSSVFEDYSGYQLTIDWFKNKNGEYTTLIKNYVKSYYPNAQITVLFFPPSVVDGNLYGGMMAEVNFPKEQWKGLDFFQMEDYDWIILQDNQHNTLGWNVVQRELEYDINDIQYFAGFALTGPSPELWERINYAAWRALKLGFKDVFIWASTQIRRDNWQVPKYHRVYPSPQEDRIKNIQYKRTYPILI